MLLTVIPYFREVIVVSFHCDHCGYKNNDIQAAGEIQPLGSVYTVKCNAYDDLDRQLVKSEHCLISIPEYQLQIPAGRGQFTTIEGVLSDTIRDLEHDQPLRRIQHPELFEKIGELVEKLRLIVPDLDKDDTLDVKPEREAQGPMPHFTLKLDDPSGNSFVETRGGLNDPKWRKQEYGRSKEQDNALGLAHDESQSKETSHYPEEVLSFPGVCSLCGSELETLMKTVNIPHFKVRFSSLSPAVSGRERREKKAHFRSTETGHYSHVDQLSRLRVPRHGSKIWRCDRRQGTKDHAQGRGIGRSLPGHPQGTVALSVPR